jgi:hypothetical protein
MATIVLVQQGFEGSIVAEDGTILGQQVEVVGRRAKRGDGHILHWRGMFNLPDNVHRRPMFGETLHIRLADSSQIATVVTEIAGQTVYFRARGKMPKAVA